MVGILKGLHNYSQKSCNFIYESTDTFTKKYHHKSILATAVVINTVIYQYFAYFTPKHVVPNIEKACIISFTYALAFLTTTIYYSKACPEEFKNFKKLRSLDKTKEVAANTILVLQSTYDPNDALSGNTHDVFDFPKLEKAGYNLIFKDITTKDDIQDAINHVAGKAKAIWFRMHGIPGRMRVSKNEVFSYDDVDKMAPTLKKVKDCRIVLYACDTGSPNGKNPNMKEAFERLGFEVDAPSFAPCGTKITSLNPLKVGFKKYLII